MTYFEECPSRRPSGRGHRFDDRREAFGMIGRHGRSERGFGRGFRGGADDGDFGDSHLPRGRKLGSGDLQLLVLALLAERPCHGYQLIKLLEERSNGFYTPSPGMIYPALTYLEELGYAHVQAEGSKKLYAISEAGAQHLADNKAAIDAMFAQLSRIGDRMARVRRAFADTGAEDSTDGYPAELQQARQALKSALRDKRGASLEEYARIADILRKAAADIRGH